MEGGGGVETGEGGGGKALGVNALSSGPELLEDKG